MDLGRTHFELVNWDLVDEVDVKNAGSLTDGGLVDYLVIPPCMYYVRTMYEYCAGVEGIPRIQYSHLVALSRTSCAV